MSAHQKDPSGSTSGYKPFGFPKTKHAKFVIDYILYKVFYFWRDVKSPRLRLFMYEMVYSGFRAVHRPPPALRCLDLEQIITTFGTFHIRPGTTDAACVSPAFERLDLNHLVIMLKERLSRGRRVLFIDAGADIGTYSISVANFLRSAGEIRIVAFEPSESSFALLRKNVDDNGLHSVVEPRRIGLGDGLASSAILRIDPREPGGSGLGVSPDHELFEEIPMSTIDAQLEVDEVADVVALKVDVEGGEIALLDGAAATLAAANEVILLVEDFVDLSVVSYLQDHGWSFCNKLTPYNSFWTISPASLGYRGIGLSHTLITAYRQSDPETGTSGAN